jgi:hypothetical protein
MYTDLRTIGSPDGVLAADEAGPADRAARLLVDLLGQLHDALLNAVLDNEALVEDGNVITKADELLAAITSIRVTGDVERSVEAEQRGASTGRASFGGSLKGTPGAEASMSSEAVDESRGLLRETRKALNALHRLQRLGPGP